jgi:phosphocarrier protein
MRKVTREITIKNPQGLHARPAAMFVQVAAKYTSKVTLQKGDEKVNGKSIMGILTLGAQKDCQVILDVEGPDAEQAVMELEELLLRDNIQ